jgi:RecJ-like exonuclease
MKEITCKRCQSNLNVELHHKVPRCIGGLDIDGRVYLCKKCHDIWHHMLPKFMMKFINSKKDCRQHIARMCDWFIEKTK